MTSSAATLPSDGTGGLRWRVPGAAIVAAALAALVSLAAWLCWRNGSILYYGDAASHLNLSRGMLDSRTPGYDQLGTVWLPVLHVICLPFVWNDRLWSTGLAGTFPVAACFVVAGVCFYLAAMEVYARASAAAAVVACFALNPNILYLAVIPMTEVVFLAALAVVLLAELRFRRTQRLRWITLGIAASWSLALTRYDGWFLLPFIALWFASSAKRRRRLTCLLAGAAASLAPLYWIAYNWYETGNALDFFNGPYSAGAIQGGKTYPGDHDWLAAVHYYCAAGRLCTGLPLIILALAGTFAGLRHRALFPLLFLLLTPLFYIWSMHSTGGTPVYIPTLWPFSYYNSRYGIASVPLCAFAAGALVLARPRHSALLACLLPAVAALPWIIHASPENWICWKESQVNSVDRRAWTAAAARFLAAQYRSGQGILTSTGDVTGIYCATGIHLSETLSNFNGPEWFLATRRPDLYHPNKWLIMQAGDGLSKQLFAEPSPYGEIRSFTTSKFSPPLSISARRAP